MKITYKRELKHNYLIIEPEEMLYDSYEIRMVASNVIEGLLKFHVKQVDSRKSYYYEITSRQPLSRLLECRSIGAEELKRLIIGISQTISRLDAYLLREERILMEPEFIYVEPEQYTLGLCLVPGKQGDFPEDMTNLLQYLLGKVNHQDKECVVLAYGLYQESLKENYGIDDLLKLLAQGKAEDASNARKNYKNNKDNKIMEEEETENNFKEEGGKGMRRPDYFINQEADDTAWWQDDNDFMTDIVSEATGAALAHRVLLKMAPFISAVLGGPVLVWFLYGSDGIKTYWYILLGIDVLAFFLSIYQILQVKEGDEKREKQKLESYNFRNSVDSEDNSQIGNPSSVREMHESAYNTPKKIGRNYSVNKSEKAKTKIIQREAGRNTPQKKSERYSWQMAFEDEEEREGQKEGQKEGQRIEKTGAPAEFEAGTVLLTGSTRQEGARYLRALSDEIEDIVISYVPFIIGKQEGLVDFVLNCETVSRIHARIDQEGEEYRITDLNSTNGTIVGKKVLETNETAVLLPGDEVYIANLGFIFT